MDILLDPWSWWIEPFLENSDIQRALLAAALVILCSSTIGSWVVIRGMSFFADALAHGVLPGISIALAINGNTVLGAAIAAVFMIAGIRSVRKFSPLPNDVSIGLLLVGMLALTLVLIGTSDQKEEQLHEILFGNLLNVTGGNLLLQAIITVVILIGTFFFYRTFLTTTFDSTLSGLLKLRPEIAEFALLLMLAASMIAGFQAVGSLLIFAMLIAPPATGAIIFKKVWAVMLAAVVQGLFSSFLGILIGHHGNTSASGAIGLVAVSIFFVVLIVKMVVLKANTNQIVK